MPVTLERRESCGYDIIGRSAGRSSASGDKRGSIQFVIRTEDQGHSNYVARSRLLWRPQRLQRPVNRIIRVAPYKDGGQQPDNTSSAQSDGLRPKIEGREIDCAGERQCGLEQRQRAIFLSGAEARQMTAGEHGRLLE